MNHDAYIELANTEDNHWWFVGRRNILKSIITSLKLPANSKILEIGSGTGGNLTMLSHFGHVCALEMSATAKEVALKKHGTFYDIRLGSFPTENPFINKNFDLICMFDVLEHIEDDLAVLFAIKNMLRKDGHLLITVPAYNWLWSAHDKFLHHKRRYSLPELRNKIITVGLQPIRISYFSTFLSPLIIIARLKDKLLNKAVASRTDIPNNLANKLLRNIFSLEKIILQQHSFPFGISLLAICKIK